MGGTGVDGEPGVTSQQHGADRAPSSPLAASETWPTGRLLSAAARRVERAWDDYLEQWGLTHASLPPLVVLLEGPLSQRDIAARLHITEQSVGRMLAGLQQQGYIARERHPTDQRRRVVRLTPQGRATLAELDQSAAVEALVGNAFSAAEREQLREFLLRIIAQLPGAGRD